jgi:hypothetical protein
MVSGLSSNLFHLFSIAFLAHLIIKGLEVREDLEYAPAASAFLERDERGSEKITIQDPQLLIFHSTEADLSYAIIAYAAASYVHQAVLSDLNYRHSLFTRSSMTFDSRIFKNRHEKTGGPSEASQDEIKN